MRIKHTPKGEDTSLATKDRAVVVHTAIEAHITPWDNEKTPSVIFVGDGPDGIRHAVAVDGADFMKVCEKLKDEIFQH